MRYSEAQKTLQAGGVFQPLQVNPLWGIPAPSGPVADSLWKAEQSYGTLLHGLLLQRTALTAGLREILNEHPTAAGTVNRVFGSDDFPFRAYSDQLVQYTCGKRAELIEARRKLVEASVPSAARRIQAIPPSPQFLFDSDQMMDVVKQLPSAPHRQSRSFRRSSAFRTSAHPVSTCLLYTSDAADE